RRLPLVDVEVADVAQIVEGASHPLPVDVSQPGFEPGIRLGHDVFGPGGGHLSGNAADFDVAAGASGRPGDAVVLRGAEVLGDVHSSTDADEVVPLLHLLQRLGFGNVLCQQSVFLDGNELDDVADLAFAFGVGQQRVGDTDIEVVAGPDELFDESEPDALIGHGQDRRDLLGGGCLHFFSP